MLTVHHEPQKITTENVETSFLEFFHRRDYVLLAGSPLVDETIKMSFVMSAGLVQVERALRQSGQPLERHFALVQTCFRHFDMMESVGSSLYHLSLFRMAGVFYFGEIDRQARIAEIWDLISMTYQLRRESLWVTYYSGGEVFGYSFEPDGQSKEEWLAVGIPSRQIVSLEENFWKQSPLMGASGEPLKCGPNCEIFFDRGKQFACQSACQPGCSCGRFVEFLNILFIGWEHDQHSGRIQPLTEPFVEVVIGVERLAMILNRAPSVFEVDSLPLICGLLEKSSGSKAVKNEARENQVHLLADHIRAMLFLVADGAPRPGHGGRARLMRRLARNILTAQILLDLPLSSNNRLSPAIPQLLDVLFEFYRAEPPFPGHSGPRMLEAHPGLVSAPEKLLEFLETEACLFEETTRKGLLTLDKLIDHRPTRCLSGSEMLALVISEGLPEAYLTWALDQKQINYSWQEYLTERAKWQATPKS